MTDTRRPRPAHPGSFCAGLPSLPCAWGAATGHDPYQPARLRPRPFPPWPPDNDDPFDPLVQEPPVTPSSAPGPRPSLYARAGGPATLHAIVEIFYDRVLADPALAPYFRGVDERRLRLHQRWFLGAVLGGPDTYTGRDLAGAHAGLGITDAAFDLVVGHLLTAFEDFGTSAADRAEIATALTAHRPAIVDGAAR